MCLLLFAAVYSCVSPLQLVSDAVSWRSCDSSLPHLGVPQAGWPPNLALTRLLSAEASVLYMFCCLRCSC